MNFNGGVWINEGYYQYDLSSGWFMQKQRNLSCSTARRTEYETMELILKIWHLHVMSNSSALLWLTLQCFPWKEHESLQPSIVNWLWNKKPRSYLLSWLFVEVFFWKRILERVGELFLNMGINAVLIPLLWDIEALRHQCLSVDWFWGVTVFWWFCSRLDRWHLIQCASFGQMR